MVYSVKGTCIHYLLAPSVQHFNASGKESSTNLDQSTCTILSGNRYSTRGFIPKGALLWLGIMVSPTVPDSKDVTSCGNALSFEFFSSRFRRFQGHLGRIRNGWTTRGETGESVRYIYREAEPLTVLANDPVRGPCTNKSPGGLYQK